MPTQSEIDAQYELERTAISCGLQRLHKNTYNVESKDYASASIYGVASVDTLIPLVVAKIEDTEWKIRKGNSGVAFKEIAAYLSGVEPLASAGIACKLVNDLLSPWLDLAGLRISAFVQVPSNKNIFLVRTNPIPA